MIDFDCMLAL